VLWDIFVRVVVSCNGTQVQIETRDLALASMVRDDPPASSTAATMRGKVGSEFET